MLGVVGLAAQLSPAWEDGRLLTWAACVLVTDSAGKGFPESVAPCLEGPFLSLPNLESSHTSSFLPPLRCLLSPVPMSCSWVV